MQTLGIMGLMQRKPTVASLFSGAGGMDIGFRDAGFEVVWANDYQKDACETHRKWSGSEIVCADVADLDPAMMPDADVILGGFPCQGFSLAGNREVDDSRNLLYRHFVKCVSVKKPLAFVAENVKGILSIGGSKRVARAIVSAFMKEGYFVRCKLLNASGFGVPQERMRMVFVGIRDDLDVMPTLPVPDETGATLKSAIWGMGKPDECDLCKSPFSSRYMSRNRWKGWDETSFTILAMANQAPLHPSSPRMVQVGKDEWKFGDGETRRMSWRETALVQTFPRELEFSGSLTSKYRQVGNAVPCKLAERVARCLKDDLEKGGA